MPYTINSDVLMLDLMPPAKEPKLASQGRTTTAFICRQPPQEDQRTMQIRKFKARCGTYFEAHIGARGRLKLIKQLDACRKDCASCLEQQQKIKEIVAMER